MITPLMYLLTGYDEDFNYNPVNNIEEFLAETKVLQSEIKRLGNILFDEFTVNVEEIADNKIITSTNQIVATEIISISPYTALLIDRAKLAYEKYKNQKYAVKEISTSDIVTRIEGSSYNAYKFVFNTMHSSATYKENISKIKDILDIISTNSVELNSNTDKEEINKRFEVQSNVSYWSRMLGSDYIRIYNEIGPPFTAKTIETIKEELKRMGINGFVNPLGTNQNLTKIARKTYYNISDDIIDYLKQIVLSGGGTVI